MITKLFQISLLVLTAGSGLLLRAEDPVTVAPGGWGQPSGAYDPRFPNPQNWQPSYKYETVYERGAAPMTQSLYPLSAIDNEAARVAFELRAIGKEDEKYAAKVTELREVLNKTFDSMHAEHEQELTEARQRLDALVKRHQQRAENKNQIVDRRLNELMGQEDSLRWQVTSQPLAPIDTNNIIFPHTVDGRQLLPLRWPTSGQPAAPDFTPPAIPTATPFFQPPFALGGNSLSTQVVSPPRSSIETVFSLARDVAAAKAEQEDAEIADKSAEKLRSEGAITSSERMKASARLKRATQDLEIRNVQVNAIRQAMQRAIETQKANVERLREMLTWVKNKFEQGTTNELEVMQSEDRMTKAIDAFNRAVTELEQFDEVMKTINEA